MIKLFFLSSAIFLFGSVYEYNFKDIDDNEINLGQFSGKKILLVNTSSGSEFVNQYRGLEQLYQKYKDSLVIIAFPSNSFGHETLDNAGIKEFVKMNYNIHYILAQKVNVTNSNKEPIYNWITQSSKNGVMNNLITNDFYKFLIDKSGNLIGAFTSSVDPMSNELQSAIAN